MGTSSQIGAVFLTVEAHSASGTLLAEFVRCSPAHRFSSQHKISTWHGNRACFKRENRLSKKPRLLHGPLHGVLNKLRIDRNDQELLFRLRLIHKEQHAAHGHLACSLLVKSSVCQQLP